MSESTNIEVIDSPSEPPSIEQLSEIHVNQLSRNTIINVESYPDIEENKFKDVNAVISPRIKSKVKNFAIPPSNEKKAPEEKGNNKHFNDFLDKMEKFQKAKNEKINMLQAIKKEQEEIQLNSIPKVKMSDNSKKILENRKKKAETPHESLLTTKSSPYTPSPQPLKNTQEKKLQSSSSKKTLTKILFENSVKTIPNELIIPKQTVVRESPSIIKSEKVLALKFIKEFNNKFDVISGGKTELDMDETILLLQDMFFFIVDSDFQRAEIEGALFKKMWKILGAEESNEISMDNLKTFLLGIMNYFIPTIAHDDESTSLGKFISEKYYLRQEEVLRIHRMFMPLYENRISMLKKVGQQKKIDKFSKMQDIFKNLKCNDTKITYGSFKSKEVPNKPRNISEKKKRKKIPVVASKAALDFSRSQKVLSNRDPNPNHQKSSQLLLNSSFHSARSTSRSASRSRLAKQNSMKSINSDNESKILSADKISDPSILLKAKDILGQFSLLPKKRNKSPVVTEKDEPSEPSSTSKLIYKNKCRLKSVNSKNIDDQLKRATELLRQNKLEDDFNNEEIVVDVNMPNGTQKTLVIPQNANKVLAVRKFVKENHLSPEMGQTLLNSIQAS